MTTATVVFLLVSAALAALISYGIRQGMKVAREFTDAERAVAMWLAEFASNMGTTATLNTLATAAYNEAVRKGWHDKLREVGTVLALVHSELSEALEEWRQGKELTEIYYEGNKPTGYAIELADAVIRILHHAAAEGIDLERAVLIKMAYNATRPYRHGGKLA